MNTSPSAKTILCYGDSNTWGQKPDKSGRYPANVRWTGMLQDTLGNDYYVTEEGLGSRTTDLEYSRKPGRNGKTYLLPCLESHLPLDVVVLMLGTNDLKIEFNRSAAGIANALSGLIAIIQTITSKKGTAPPARILLVSPAHVNDQAPDFKEWYLNSGFYNHESVLKSQQLAGELEAVATELGCDFIDASAVAEAGEDGLHFDEASHSALGKLLARKVQEILA